MIKRIRVQNFLSLKDVELDLRDRNVFVGANMSGKSNLIECFKFLQEALTRSTTPEVSSLQQAFTNRGGFAEIPWQGHEENPIRFEITADLVGRQSKQTNSFVYSISLRRGEDGNVEVEFERLSVKRKGEVESLLENDAGGVAISTDGELAPRGSQNLLGLALEMYRNNVPPAGDFLDFVSKWRFYRLVPTLMRSGNAPEREAALTEHGANLSSWFLTLQNYPRDFEVLRQVAQDALPGLAGILFQSKETPKPPISRAIAASAAKPAKISIGASETYHPNLISIARMSDGELVFLALLSLILAPEKLRPSLLCIEEPENYLHPRLLEILVELLNQPPGEGDSSQVIATTHSLSLVDKISLDELVVTDKIEGETRFNRASNKRKLRELLSRKELSLGDLWYSGALSAS